MRDFYARVRQTLEEIDREGLTKPERVIASCQGAEISVGGRSILNSAPTNIQPVGDDDIFLAQPGAGAAISQAIAALAMGGKLALLGIPSGAMEFNWSELIVKAITVKGVYGRQMFETWRKMLGLLHAGLDLAPLITHDFPAAQFQDGFAAALSGNSGKTILRW